MSSGKSRKDQKRAELLRRLSDLGRKISTQTVFLHQAIAQAIGLNATDTKCLDLIASEPDGTVTAGRLSDLTGLTTGAITHIVDRLERRGFVERVRDTGDRRRLFVRERAGSLEPLLPKYEAIGKAYMAVAGQYSDDELSLICGYMDKASELTERLMADMIAARRPPGTRAIGGL
jgi:DNA-binding MarR family transcriptional regulator